MNLDKLKRDLIASRNILAVNIEAFHTGHRDVYRVVAVELRKLLCDKQALLATLFPKGRLNPTKSYMPNEDLAQLNWQIPAKFGVMEDGKPFVERVFDERREPIELDEWLNQPFFSASITVRDFIKSVADKEGAHADSNWNEALMLAKSMYLAEEQMLGLLTVAMGEYILKVLNLIVRENSDQFGI